MGGSGWRELEVVVFSSGYCSWWIFGMMSLFSFSRVAGDFRSYASFFSLKLWYFGIYWLVSGTWGYLNSCYFTTLNLGKSFALLMSLPVMLIWSYYTDG